MQYRTMCVVRITLLLGGILCVEAAFAKTDSGVFKLEEVIELAMERNPVVAGAAATVKQARGERVIAGAYPNPSITGGLGLR